MVHIRANDDCVQQHHIESTVQVKGSANILVTVVTTQELEAGDELWRFKAESAQDDPRRGNINN